MRVHLMNSAMMPCEGLYCAYRITKEQFKQYLNEAYEQNRLYNYIGYEQNLSLIAEWCDIRLPVSRDEVQLKNGDIMLVMKLKYRLKNVGAKINQQFQSKLSEDDFEFYVIKYTNSLKQ